MCFKKRMFYACCTFSCVVDHWLKSFLRRLHDVYDSTQVVDLLLGTLAIDR